MVMHWQQAINQHNDLMTDIGQDGGRFALQGGMEHPPRRLLLSCTIWMYYTYLLLDGLFHIPFNQTTILVCTLNMSATEFNNQHADMCSCKHRCVKLKPNFLLRIYIGLLNL